MKGHTLAEAVEGGARRARQLVVEAQVVVDEIADRLDASPTGRRLFEQGPGDIGQPVGLAIPAAQKIDEGFRRQIFNLMLDRTRGQDVGKAGILDDAISR